MAQWMEQELAYPGWQIPSRHEKTYELVGQSARLRQVLRLAAKLGRGHWPVLLLGETGTGKELVARTIHRAQASAPFVVVDCTTMSGTLMESELFGHVKGAFTGATTNKIGLIEEADGGTAFFDEIGELPLDLQAKLLRVLQEKEFRPVGATTTRRSSFRVIAATNRDLTKEVEAGRFRQDLFYRLNVVSLRLAPLRERKDDLPSLISHFLSIYGSGHTLSGELLDMLIRYDWPGNVRELENSIQHMVAVNTGPVLHAGDVPSAIRNRAAERGCARNGASSPVNAPAAEGFVMPILPLSEMEKRAIVQALQYTKGDRVMAASLLGIGRTTLYRKIKEYGIQV